MELINNMVRLTVKVIPKSSRNKISEMPGGILKVKLTAPATEGKANTALIKLLSHHFALPQSKIKIAKGMASRNKIIEILN